MADQLAVFKSLQNPTRLEILHYLGDHPQDISYSDLLPFCDGSTGKLNYHLRTMDDLLLKTEDGYNLSDKGTRVLAWLNNYKNLDEIETSFDRPQVVINKIYPDQSLLYKYYCYIGLGFAPVIIGLIILFIYAGVILPLIGTIVIAFIASLVAGWYYDSIWYRITETEIEVFKGIITYTHKIVPFRTITNVDQKQGPFDRIFGISSVNIHTAGNSGQTIGPEEQIVGMIEGEEIKDTILERIRLLNPIDFSQQPQSAGRNNVPKIQQGLQLLRDELKSLNQELNHI